MQTAERQVTTVTDDGEMVVVINEPTSSPDGGGDWPTVLWFIDAPGIRPAVREAMGLLASNGYKVVTPDLHHRQGRLLYKEPADMADPNAGVTVRGWIKAMTDEQIQHDGACALDAAGTDEQTPYVVIGFCLGTRAAYLAIEQNPDRVLAGSCFHPSYMADDTDGSPHRSASHLTRPMYFGIGEADELQTIAMHQRFLDAVAPLPHVEVMIFPDVGHGFTWPGYPNYNQTAADTSWSKTLALFSSAFSQPDQ